MRFTNPLRYPGGKFRLAPYISSILEKKRLIGCTFIEPYAGSAAISLYLLRHGLVYNAHINEIDPLIRAFWHCVFFETEAICREINDTPINIDTWKSLEYLRDVSSDSDISVLKMGYAGLFFNRTNFSGIMLANPIGGKNQNSKYSIDCRFNKKSIIEEIVNISRFADRVTITGVDGIELIQHYNCADNSFIYVDPPYFYKGKQLYRFYFTIEQHKQLADEIKKCSTPWLVSYDDSDYIRSLYSFRGINCESLNWDYHIRNKSTTKELIFSNFRIDPDSLG